MKNVLLLLLLVMIAACKVDDQDFTPTLQANAMIYNNNLPVDGCAEHISLMNTNGDETKTLLPTEATKVLLSNLLNTEIAKIPKGEYSGNLRFLVSVKYRTTSEKGELLCGWGRKSTVERIEIISITKK